MPSFYGYTPHTPDENAPPSQSPIFFQENFTSIQNLIAEDHFSFKDNLGGAHKQSTYIDTADASKNVQLYGQIAATFCELFMERNGGTPIQLSTKAGDPVATASGQTFLPGGLIMKWGSNSGASPVVFPIAFPNNCFNVQLTANSNGSQFNVTSISKTSFTFSSLSNFCYWIAIGN